MQAEAIVESEARQGQRGKRTTTLEMTKNGCSRSAYRLRSLSATLTIDDSGNSAKLSRKVSVLQLIAFGVGSSVGAGVYSVVGIAAISTGPAISLSFCLAAVACIATGFTYAEFAARTPLSGSAYTYSYHTFGELFAWLVGWNLTLEYGIVAAAIARSFADYATVLVGIALSFNLGPLSCSPVAAVTCVACAFAAAAGATVSARANIVITSLNVAFLILIIVAGSTRAKISNWFAINGSFVPFGFSSIVAGGGRIFFCFIGFDTVSCMSEEAVNPRRDIPIGILASLVITSLLYIAVSLVLTALVPSDKIDPAAPIAAAFAAVGMRWCGTAVSVGALFGTAACALTALVGQIRIFFRMAVDGLWFPVFAKVHQRTGVPVGGSLIIGAVAAILAFTTSLDTLSSAISVGTLAAFCAVNAGVIVLRYQSRESLVLVLLFAGSCFVASFCFTLKQSTWTYCVSWGISVVPVVLLFFCKQPGLSTVISFWCPLVPFIPCFGLAVNIFMLAGLDILAWIRILVWVAIGLAVYLSYGIWHSNLREKQPGSPAAQEELESLHEGPTAP